jgi:predicted HTH transcriptional regulator
LLKDHLKINPFAIIEFNGTISERERDILELVREKGSVTRRECQTVLGLRQRDAQNGLYFLHKLGVLNRELGKRNTARYFIQE